MFRWLGNKGTTSPQPDTPRVLRMEAAELQAKLGAEEQVVMVDVRSSGEYAHDGHIAGSRLLPLPVLAMRLEELPTDQPIVCVCRSGNRSHVAAEMLVRKLNVSVYNLEGGVKGWAAAGYSLEQG